MARFQLSDYEIDDKAYKADFEMLDRYLQFSSELLRLSLLAIGGFGALMLIDLKGESKGDPYFHQELRQAWFLLGSMVLFALSAGAALAHRFYASDAMAYFLAHLRAVSQKKEDKAVAQYSGFRSKLNVAGCFLLISEWIFAIAVVAFAIGIVLLLFRN